MPIYEYQCRACGQAFEQLASGQSAPTCPACASESVTRRLSLFGVRTQSRPAGSASGGGCGCARGGCGCH